MAQMCWKVFYERLSLLIIINVVLNNFFLDMLNCRNSDIWRNLPKILLKYVAGPIFRIIYLDSRQGAQTSIAAAVGKFPQSAHYLQPYWQPCFSALIKKSSSQFVHCSYPVPFPVSEMLGPFIGYAVTNARLPNDGAGGLISSSDLWNASEKLIQ